MIKKIKYIIIPITLILLFFIILLVTNSHIRKKLWSYIYYSDNIHQKTPEYKVIPYNIYNNISCYLSNPYNIPKKIWSYWDNPDNIPDSVKICNNSWKKYNSNYEIILLNKYTYKNFINIPINRNFNYTIHQMADLIRIYILAKYGGIWLDSTILLSAPLDEWLYDEYLDGSGKNISINKNISNSNKEYIGYYLDGITSNKKYPVIENWFFACKKGSNFLSKWRDEFSQLFTFKNENDYVNSRKDMGIDIQGIEPMANYLTMHIACQKVLQIDKYPLDTLLLRKAEEGPYLYLISNNCNWNSHKAINNACYDKSLRTNILKMRGGEREYLDKSIKEGIYSNERCEWI